MIAMRCVANSTCGDLARHVQDVAKVTLVCVRLHLHEKRTARYSALYTSTYATNDSYDEPVSDGCYLRINIRSRTPLGRQRCRWEDNIKTTLKKLGWKGS